MLDHGTLDIPRAKRSDHNTAGIADAAATISRNEKPQPLAAPPRAEIWIRQVGARRQAFYRCRNTESGPRTWAKLHVTKADKALHVGTLDLGSGGKFPAFLHHEDAAPAHPMRDQFAQQAHSLNRDIDALNLSARGAA